ncbi:integral membrane protein [Paraphaeosphaeria sporulosa]
MLALPVKLFLKLQMSRRQRISLVADFGAGVFVCAVAIERTIMLPALLNSSDYTWDVVPQLVRGFLGVNTGLVCAALPALKPLFTRHLPQFLSSRPRDSNRGISDSLPFPNRWSVTAIDAVPARRFLSPGITGARNLTKLGGDDNEMHLWPNRGKGTAHTGSKDVSEEIGFKAMYHKTHGSRNSVRTVVSAAPGSMKLPRQSLAHSITVTTETRIERYTSSSSHE